MKIRFHRTLFPHLQIWQFVQAHWFQQHLQVDQAVFPVLIRISMNTVRIVAPAGTAIHPGKIFLQPDCQESIWFRSEHEEFPQVSMDAIGVYLSMYPGVWIPCQTHHLFSIIRWEDLLNIKILPDTLFRGRWKSLCDLCEELCALRVKKDLNTKDTNGITKELKGKNRIWRN